MSHAGSGHGLPLTQGRRGRTRRGQQIRSCSATGSPHTVVVPDLMHACAPASSARPLCVRSFEGEEGEEDDDDEEGAGAGEGQAAGGQAQPPECKQQ